ncbi:hypothetical protein LCGC14_2015070 [marine sediment metagenome]|uniref:Uncharacterized protein n=1 Tax=marine sediment metagenome TaxID=412755 RepID=A0A0F9EZC8_9ZZZZ
MAVGDALSIFTGGWFQTDGEVPNQVEVFTDGHWNVLVGLIPYVEALAAVVIFTETLAQVAVLTETLAADVIMTETLSNTGVL